MTEQQYLKPYWKQQKMLESSTVKELCQLQRVHADLCQGHTPSPECVLILHTPQKCGEQTWENNQWVPSELMLDEVANKNRDSFFFEIQENIMIVSN